jgi:hypothetical protein
MGPDDDLVDVSSDGNAHPIGSQAAIRMQSRVGRFHVLPSPPHIISMRRAADRAEPLRACLLSGEIRSAGLLTDLISFVAHTGRRGEFVVQEANSARSIFFDEGHVVGASSTVVRERLGEVLYRCGVLTREQVDVCGDATATGDLRFGEVAVKRGFVTREKLFSLMARQSEEIFYGMLLVSDAMFYFLEGYDDAQLSSRQKLTVTALLREGIRRMHEMQYFRARIPSEHYVPVRPAGSVAPEVDPLGVYAAVDGRSSVSDLCRVLEAGEFDVTRALFQLIQAHRLIVRPPRLPAPAIVDVFNHAIALILRELDAMDEGDAVRAQLATFAEQVPLFRELCTDAGPADDGTLDPAIVAAKVSRAPSTEETEDRLAGFLYEFASYALFLARPHLRRFERGGARRKQRISTRVSAMLDPIAEKKSPQVPGSRGPVPPKKKHP